MKILKPGKVEMRKFVCPRCGCEFATNFQSVRVGGDVRCPQDGCTMDLLWAGGEPYEEPYEEPMPTQTDEERMIDLLRDCRIDMVSKWAEILADYLIRNGVTFGRELDEH